MSSLKERPVSPPPGTSTSSQTQITNSGMATMTSLPSPLPGSDSPIPGTPQPNSNILVNTTVGVGPNVGQSNVYRPPGAQGGFTCHLIFIEWKGFNLNNVTLLPHIKVELKDSYT